MSTLQTTNIKNPSSTTNNIVLASNGSTTVGNLVATQIQGGAITSGTAVASTSGTSIDFTSIPSWVKRVTVMFNGVSTNGTSNLQIQIGTSSGVETSGYIGATGYGGSGATTWNTSGYLLYNIMAAANTLSGAATVTLLSSNTWTLTGLLAMNTFNGPCLSAGSKALSGTLDRIRITTVNGTDTFDAGSINILYEG